MFRYSWILFFIVFYTIYWSVKGGAFTSSVVSAEEIGQALRIEANQLNSQLPRMVDELTQLTEVTVGEKCLNYWYLLPTLRASDIEGMMDWEQLESMAREYSRGNRNFMRLFDYGITVNYYYEGMDGEEVGSFDLTPDEMQ